MVCFLSTLCACLRFRCWPHRLNRRCCSARSRCSSLYFRLPIGLNAPAFDFGFSCPRLSVLPLNFPKGAPESPANAWRNTKSKTLTDSQARKRLSGYNTFRRCNFRDCSYLSAVTILRAVSLAVSLSAKSVSLRVSLAVSLAVSLSVSSC